MFVKTFYDENNATFTYIIVDLESKKCAIIDSVLDYDHFSGTVKTQSADQVIKYIQDNELDNQWILETHIHADHITASSYLKSRVGGKTAIGKGIKDVLAIWVPLLDIRQDTSLTGTQFDCLLDEGEEINIGSIKLVTWLTPGHTPACVSYYCREFDSIFVGDTIFSPSIGTARCDFPGGSASDLFATVQRFYGLPDHTTMYLCHDYPPEGEPPLSTITVGEQKASNVQIKATTQLADYVAKREKRDKSLSVPKLLFPSIQSNLRLGQFGTTSENGLQYIKVPINALEVIDKKT
jgi:glyoxylase-like metal-dependent hydrolase (beta-lactamase superfamily II)